MVVEIKIKCNECSTGLSDGEGVICESCYDDAVTRANEFEDEANDSQNTITGLEEERDELQTQIEELQERIKYLEKVIDATPEAKEYIACDEL